MMKDSDTVSAVSVEFWTTSAGVMRIFFEMSSSTESMERERVFVVVVVDFIDMKWTGRKETGGLFLFFDILCMAVFRCRTDADVIATRTYRFRGRKLESAIIPRPLPWQHQFYTQVHGNPSGLGFFGGSSCSLCVSLCNSFWGQASSHQAKKEIGFFIRWANLQPSQLEGYRL